MKEPAQATQLRRGWAVCVLGWGTEPRCEPGPVGLHGPAHPAAPSGRMLSLLVPRPTCSTKYTLAASRRQAFERRGHLAQLLLFILRLLPRLPRSGTSRWRDRWRVRRLRGQQAHPSPRGHRLALQAAGAARRHSPPTAVEASPGRGLVSGSSWPPPPMPPAVCRLPLPESFARPLP